jgi:muramoyltetrapeptide carboxypeptidase LdcA involved in peptidoglycan recycling
VFLGFSDTTISHLACFKAGLVSFYGPSILAGFAENGGMFPYTVESLRKTLFSAEAIGEVQPNTAGWTAELLDWGIAENQARRRKLQPSTGWNFLQGQGLRRGRLLGGCFEVLDWLRGTDYWPAPEQWQGAMLFLETSEEAPPPAQVRYGLRALAALGVLERISGLLFARPGGPVPLEQFAAYDQAILQVVRDEEGLAHLPVVTQMDFGHTDPVFVLPYGVDAEIDCDRRRFSIVENAVTN